MKRLFCFCMLAVFFVAGCASNGFQRTESIAEKEISFYREWESDDFITAPEDEAIEELAWLYNNLMKLHLFSVSRDGKGYSLLGVKESGDAATIYRQSHLRRPYYELYFGDIILFSMDLSENSWRFSADREREGHLRGWYETGFDDSLWAEAFIGEPWHTFLNEKYVGAGWYRCSFEVPELIPGRDVVLHFEGVDEMSWVWVNGHYMGEHNIGPIGWDRPFRFDVTDVIKPGTENQVTVRVKNTENLGGIWLPVHLDVMDVPYEDLDSTITEWQILNRGFD